VVGDFFGGGSGLRGGGNKYIISAPREVGRLEPRIRRDETEGPAEKRPLGQACPLVKGEERQKKKKEGRAGKKKVVIVVAVVVTILELPWILELGGCRLAILVAWLVS
jgi:hypothetical protein